MSDLNLYSITSAADVSCNVIALYKSAFPEEERRPVEKWLSLVGTTRFSLLELRQPDAGGTSSFIGLLTIWNFSSFVYVEHFAVSPELRGMGWGAVAIAVLKKRYGTLPIVLEVEPPESHTAKRRVRFYERQGFVLSIQPYLQPPYVPNGRWLPLCLMSTASAWVEQRFSAVKSVIYEQVYGFKETV